MRFETKIAIALRPRIQGRAGAAARFLPLQAIEEVEKCKRPCWP
jgi:hypothetical protein